jgi:hypothetical protein
MNYERIIFLGGRGLALCRKQQGLPETKLKIGNITFDFHFRFQFQLPGLTAKHSRVPKGLYFTCSCLVLKAD